MKNPRILIATAPFGNGHMQAAKTLKAAFEEQGCVVDYYDAASENHPMVTRLVQNGYKQMYRNWLHPVYKFSYDFLGTRAMLPVSKGFLATFGARSALKRVHEFEADAVIGTFPIPDFLSLVKNEKITIPVYMIITDYTAHPLWFNKYVRRFFIADKCIEGLVPKSLKESPLEFTISGIPVRTQFEQVLPDYNAVYEQYGLDKTKQQVLFMAGANGVAKDYDTCLLHVIEQSDANIIFISGNNEKLQATIDALAVVHPGRVCSLGYINEVAPLYHIADIVITKPGGITVSELAITKTPAIFVNPLPGQEGDNAIVFSQAGATKTVKTADEAAQLAVKILKDPSVLVDMRTSYDKLRHPDAAQTIVQTVLSELAEEKSK